MKIETYSDKLVVSNFNYHLEVTKNSFSLEDPRTGHSLIRTKTPLIFYPEFYGKESDWKVVSIDSRKVESGAVEIEVAGKDDNSEITLKVHFSCWYDHIEVAAETTVDVNVKIAYWYLFEPNMKIDFFHLHHWRNRHGAMSTYETCNLHQGGKTSEETVSFPAEMREQFIRQYDLSTYSSDWQFAPHPSFMLFQRDSVMLGVGARNLPRGFGLEFRGADKQMEHLRYNYGVEYGLEVPAGSTTSAPSSYLWLDHNGDVWDSVDHYVEMLLEDKEIGHRSLREAPHWWFRPAYCTWNDQGYLSGNSAFYNFQGDVFKGKNPVDSFDASMLDYLLDVIEEKRLEFGAVIIDDGWAKMRGDWVPHPIKFPDLRSQINRIHKMGMRVMLWMAPFDFFPGADILKKNEWMCGEGVLGRNQMPMLDFSNPKVQKEYLEPLARFLFSSEPGCLDADGLKVDFMADKVHPIFPVHDPEWRGEERFSHGWQSLMYKLLKHWKPEGQMLGANAHPHFIDCQDLVRTYDVPVSQSQHVDRAEMIRHFNPGNLVALDMSETKSLADVEEHLDIAYHHNLLYECGRIAPDPKTGDFLLGSDYYPLLKRKLKAWGNA